MADGSLVFDTKVDSSGLKKGVKGLASVALKALGVVTAAMGAFGFYATKAGSDFYAGMSEVKAISGATAKDMDKLVAKAKEMGAKTKFSATESAEALKYMAMAGWDTEKMLSGLPAIMNLAAASGEQLGLVSDIVTDAMTAFGLSADKAGHFADVLAMASSKSNTNVAMLGESFKYVAPVAGALNYTIEDTALALGLMANAGVKASIAGTALRTALTRLVKPRRETLKGFEKLGLAMEDFEGLSLREIIVKLRSEFQNLTESQKAQAAAMLFGQEAMSGMLAIINASDSDFEKLANNIDNTTGSAEKMANVMIDNLRGDITIAKSALEGLAIAFYDGIDNPLREVVQNATGYLNKLIDSFKSADDLKKELLSKGFSPEQADFQINEAGLQNAVGGFAGFSNTIGEVLSKMLGDIASYAPRLISSGIELFNSLLQGLTENKDEITKNILDSLGTALVGIGEFIPKLFEFGVELIVSLLNGIGENSSGILSKGLDIVIGFAEAIIRAVPKLAQAGLDFIVNLAKGIADNLPKLIQEVPRIINEFASAVYSLIPSILVAGFNIIIELGKGIIQAIPVLIKNIPQILMAILNVITLINWASAGKSLIMGIKNGAEGAKSSIIDAVKNIGKNIVDSIRYILSGGSIKLIGINLLQGIMSGINSLKSTIINVLKGVGTKMIDGFKAIMSPSKLLNMGTEVINGIIKGITQTAGALVSAVKEVASNALGGMLSYFGIKSPSRVTRDRVGKPIVQGIVVGILSEQSKLNDSIVNLSEEVLEIAKKEADGYEDIGKIYSEHISKGIDRYSKASINAVNRLIEGVIANLSNNKKVEAEYRKAGKEVATAYATAIKDGIAKVKEDIANEVEQITKEAKKQYDDIITKQNDMISKLSGFGELFTIDRESQEVVIESISAQIDMIKEYDEVLTRLKSKGATDEFMAKISDMSVEDAVKFGKELLKISDNQFKAYQEQWSQKQKLAKEVAMKFYKDQLDILQSDFVNRLDGTLKSVPNTVRNIGVNTIQGMIAGMESRKQGAINKAREIADAVAMEMQRAFDIHSPSRLMRDLIGKNIIKGIEVGIDSEKMNLLNSLKGLVESSKVEIGNIAYSKSRMGNIGSQVITNNNDNGVNQTLNIYAPVKSSIEMMREAKRHAKELAYGS